ncbi:MAG: hypothetical protein Q9218_004319 [Villophora microphyllina]
MEEIDDNEYVIPLQDQSVFGAGIKRKKINFVPPASVESSSISKAPTTGAGDRYLSIVFNKNKVTNGVQAASDTDIVAANTSMSPDGSRQAVCEVCKLPLHPDDAGSQQSHLHDTTIAHQICLSPSHPPSHLDRNRQGLKYLSSYGWDPDSRTGLGAIGAGIRVPIKAKPKYDTLGIGSAAAPIHSQVNKHVVKKLDAKQTREAEAKARRESQRIQQLFYQSGDVERYLGG